MGNADGLVDPPFDPLVSATLVHTSIGRTKPDIFTNNLFPRNYCGFSYVINMLFY